VGLGIAVIVGGCGGFGWCGLGCVIWFVLVMVFRAAALVVVWLAGSAGWFWDRGFVVSGLVW